MLRKKRRSIVAAIALILSSTVSLHAADRFVTNDNGGTETGSFRQVIADAFDGDTVRFASGINGIVLGAGAENTAAVNLSLLGNTGGTSLDGAGKYRILNLDGATGNAVVDSMVFQNGNLIEKGEQWNGTTETPQSNGGALLVKGSQDGTVRISNSRFDDNALSIEGDNTWARGASIFVGQYDDNGASSTYITNSSFTGNQAKSWGFTDGTKVRSPFGILVNGGAVFTSGTVVLAKTDFIDNLSWAKGGVAEPFGTDQDGNPRGALANASAYGAAVSTYEGFNIQSSNFIGNKVYAEGGIAPTVGDLKGSSDVEAGGGALLSWNNNSLDNSNIMTGSLFRGNEVRAIGGQAEAGNQQVFAYGGAVAIQASLNTVITDTSFIDNLVYAEGTTLGQIGATASGGAIRWNIFQVVDKEGEYDNEFHLKATEGNQTVFRGNKEQTKWVEEDPDTGEIVTKETTNPNSIAIVLYERSGFDTDPDPLALFAIETEKNALVALDDPFTTSISTALVMDVDGQGEFRWGGQNVLGVDSTTTINLNSGTVTLSSDFTTTFERDTRFFDATYTVDMKEGLNLNLNLTGRDQTLAMFQDVSDNQESLTFKADGVNLAAATYSLKPVDDKYLVTNNRGDVDASNFNVVDDELFGTTVLTEGTNLYVSIDNSKAIAPFRNSANANVRNAYRDGNLADVFDNVLAGVDPSEQGNVFNGFRNNTQLLAPEAVASQAIAALDYANYVDRALWQLTDHRNDATFFGGCDPCVSAGGTKGKARHLWGGYVGNTARQDDSDGYFGYRSKMDGAIVGFDKDLNRRLNAGAFFSYGNGVNRYDSLGSKIDSKAYQAGLHGTFTPKRNWSVRADVSYGHFDNDLARWNMLGTSTGSFDQDLFDLGVLAKRDFRIGKTSKLSPYAGLRYMYLSQESMSENGTNPFASQIAADHLNSFASTLGAAFSTDLKYRKTVWTPTLYADWRHEFADTQYTTGARYLNGGTWYELGSVDRARDSADLGFNIMTSWTGRQGRIWDLQLGYNANLTTDFSSQAYYATLGFRF